MRSHLRALLVPLAVASLVWGGCGNGGDDDGAGEADTSAPTTAGAGGGAGDAVTISDSQFRPDRLEVAAGTEVEWTNQDGFQHSVIADDDAFQSERLSQGDTFSHQFETAGEFKYHCGIHSAMSGTVVVGS